MSKIQNQKFIFCLLILSCSFGYSQNSGRILLECKSEILEPGWQHQQLNFSSNAQSIAIANYSFLKQTQSVKKPMFCRMEDNLHKRFNIWIVMRAGSDEEYKKLIYEENKPKHESTP
ncbi:MAG: hypothetical protein IPJ32_05265 [Sphingobacteriaceae bacterium]|nr:hypothetical protein [Sphingobacteriaceae bacterium]